MFKNKNNNISNLRKEINKIDNKMKKLFLKRMDISYLIGQYKKENNLPITDASREEEIKTSLSNDINDLKVKELYLNYLNNLITLSKQYQNENNQIIYNSFKEINKYINNQKVLLVIDEKVFNLYQDLINETLKDSVKYILPSLEENKDLKHYEEIIKLLKDNNFSRKDLIIGLGGGMILDLTGIAASTYKRGMELIYVPTTLLSMIDASIGGKNGINFENSKNQIGTFYQPKHILIDSNFLKTLDERIYNEGLAEGIKLFAISDKEYFVKLEEGKLSIDEIIKECTKIKQEICLIDPFDQNMRACLNFGHTFGHAIESYSHSINQPLYHGECVGIGMLYFSSDEVKERIKNLLIKYNLPIKVDYSFDNIEEYLINDKKKTNNVIKTIYVKEIGSFELINHSIEELKEIYNK